MCEQDWKRYRKYRFQLLTVWLASAPAALLCGVLSQSLFHSDVLLSLASVAFFVLFLYTGIRFQNFPCPRCRQSFAGKWWNNQSVFARSCHHCGLAKFGVCEE
ncbi:hypothetical protein [Silvibacterium acidisoli]|uniref:hypothetical protein n=1 Tax=Acidobacteriaceae bacterium ZG23-2 TaxID=2883246 RepID=UPI00406CE44D